MTDPNTIPKMQAFVATQTDPGFLDCYLRAVRDSASIAREFKDACHRAVLEQKARIARGRV